MRWHPGGSQGWGLSPSGSWRTYPEGHASLWKCVCCLICWPESSTLVWPYYIVCFYPALPAQMVKSLPAMQGTQFHSLVGKIPWERKWQPTAVFLPGKSHGQGSPVGSSSRGHKELDTTEQLSLSYFCFHISMQMFHRHLKVCVSNLICSLKPPPPRPQILMSTFPIQPIPKLDAREAPSISPLTHHIQWFASSIFSTIFSLYPQHHSLSLLPGLRVGMKGSEFGAKLERQLLPLPARVNDREKWGWQIRGSAGCSDTESSFVPCRVAQTSLIPTPPTQTTSTFIYLIFLNQFGLPWYLSGEESTCQCWRCGFHPWVGKMPWRRKWQYSCLENPKDRGAWGATVHGVTKSQTQLSN